MDDIPGFQSKLLEAQRAFNEFSKFVHDYNRKGTVVGPLGKRIYDTASLHFFGKITWMAEKSKEFQNRDITALLERILLHKEFFDKAFSKPIDDFIEINNRINELDRDFEFLKSLVRKL